MNLDIPLACVAIAFAQIYFPSRIMVARAQAKDPAGFDNKDPREQQARLAGEAKRALAAHNNAFEAFAPFAAAVLACELRHVNERWTVILAVTWVVARFLYPWLYVKGIDKARSGTWMIATTATSALLIMAVLGVS